MTANVTSRGLRRWALAAFAWGLGFGLLSFAWALGSDVASGTLSPSIVERFEERRTIDVAVLWITGVLKLVAGTIPVALVFRWPPAIPARWLLRACWLGGSLLALYGLADIAGGVIRAARGDENAVWYAVLWGPIWLIGGITLLASAWSDQTATAEPR